MKLPSDGYARRRAAQPCPAGAGSQGEVSVGCHSRSHLEWRTRSWSDAWALDLWGEAEEAPSHNQSGGRLSSGRSVLSSAPDSEESGLGTHLTRGPGARTGRIQVLCKARQDAIKAVSVGQGAPAPPGTWKWANSPWVSRVGIRALLLGGKSWVAPGEARRKREEGRAPQAEGAGA